MTKPTVNIMKSLFTLLLCLLAVPVAVLADDPAPAADNHVVMYKDPTCGCCEKWADHLREHGFTVESRPTEDMFKIKQLRNVPPRGASCHTADIGGFVVEGHVPAADIRRLLDGERDDIRLLTVPAMPLGSPGMEHPRPQSFRTFAVTHDDVVEVFAEHAAGEDFSPHNDNDSD